MHESLIWCSTGLFLGSLLLQALLRFWVSRNAPDVLNTAPVPDWFVAGAGFHWALHFLSARKLRSVPSTPWRIVALVSALAIVASFSLALFVALHFAATGGAF